MFCFVLFFFDLCKRGCGFSGSSPKRYIAFPLFPCSVVISADALIEDDPSELSNQITAPGILKIFGTEICEGAHYKSVLATTHSSAKELVKEALERYGLGKEESESYVLCDAIGSIGPHQWKTEGFRVVGDNEKPLLLQSLWKPREGLARRFEIQRRSSVEEKTSRDKDTVTAGRDLSESLNQMPAQISESSKISPEQNHIHSLKAPPQGSQAKTETLCPSKPRGKHGGQESQREEMESSDDNNTQYTIHPPHNCPYLLLLQGCSPTQDFIIYLLLGLETLIGRKSDREDGSKPKILLFAADILQRHCCLRRRSTSGPMMLWPGQDAVVTRNGEVLRDEVQLNPGDVIGMGQHYLFLFKDPAALMHKVKLLDTHVEMTFTDLLSLSSKEALSAGPPFLKSPDGHSLTLNYDTEDEDRIVREIISTGSGGVTDRPVLTAALLLSMCIQHSSTCLHTSDLRRLLLLIASGIQGVILIDEDSSSEDPQPLSLHEVISGLRPLMVWMSNSLELLQFIQNQLPLILEWRTRMEQGQEEVEEREDDERMTNALQRRTHTESLSCTATFTTTPLSLQVLYPILPGLLDCNPFRESPDWQVTGTSGLQVPVEVRQVVEVLNEAWVLLLGCQLHPEMSSQLIGYLFYFINASLVNSLMERGSEPGFYQWSRGVRMRANLDLVLDWAETAGQGEMALEQTHTLSSAVNLLATPRKNLLQTSWTSLRSDYPALSRAQLNHLLSLYSPASPCRHMWTPTAQDEAAAYRTAEILESFDTHHPLVLPSGGYQLQVRGTVRDAALREQLSKLQELIPSLPKVSATREQQVQQTNKHS
uniref:Si:ch211-176g6.2 n=1 Tax=Echeneis naucrates TaxID=173247 RepID=A0A665WW31_ECHNA